VNHAGDSDSTGAVTGNICGALYGVESIPDRWVGQLELRSEITKIAEKSGIFGTEAIKWNFTKFLVNRQGKVVDRYGPSTKPKALASQIETLLESTD
jgi:glutathione peroxidase